MEPRKQNWRWLFFFFSHKRLVPWKGFSRVPAGFQFYSVNLFVLSYFEILTVNEHTERRQYLHQKCTNNVPSCANDTFLFLSINEHTLWYHSEHKNPWEQSASTARSKTRLIPAVGQDKRCFFFFSRATAFGLYTAAQSLIELRKGKISPWQKRGKHSAANFSISSKFPHGKMWEPSCESPREEDGEMQSWDQVIFFFFLSWMWLGFSSCNPHSKQLS